MILGILADTHGSGRIAAQALRVLDAAGADVIVHCGDVGGEAVFNELAGRRARFVWGNSDQPGPLLNAYVCSLGLAVPTEVPLRLELAGRTIAVFHGHEPQFDRLFELANSGEVARLEEALCGADYVLFGHWHRAFDERLGSVRLINPGALNRVRTRSVATLDLRRDALRFWYVDAGEVNEPPRLLELPWTTGAQSKGNPGAVSATRVPAERSGHPPQRL